MAKFREDRPLALFQNEEILHGPARGAEGCDRKPKPPEPVDCDVVGELEQQQASDHENDGLGEKCSEEAVGVKLQPAAHGGDLLWQNYGVADHLAET
jgi:hypothetical protein